MKESEAQEIFDDYVLERVKFGLSGEYIRNEMIYRYHPDENFIQKHKLTDLFSMLAAVPEMLKDKDKMLREALSLRDCAFAHENRWKIKEPDIGDNDLHLKETDPYLLSSLEAYDSYHNRIELNRENCLITAIETDAGVLVFDYSAYGMLAQQAYLQQIADNYYLPNQKLTYLKYYDVLTSDKKLIDAARECYKSLSAIGPEFLNDNAKFFKENIVRHLEPSYQQEMNPVFWDFESFKDKFSLKENKRNVNVNYLSLIAEKGYSDKVKRYETGGQIEHANSFRGIDYRLKMNESLYERKNNIVHERLQTEARNIAKRILATQYLARGYWDPGNRKTTQIKPIKPSLIK